jgi:hypothetical protein
MIDRAAMDRPVPALTPALTPGSELSTGSGHGDILTRRSRRRAGLGDATAAGAAVRTADGKCARPPASALHVPRLVLCTSPG